MKNNELKTIYVGIDIGNSDTKSQHSSTASGFQEYYSLPFGVKDYIRYNDKFYVIDESRMPYQEDKTTNDYALIMTLFGLAKEINFQFMQKHGNQITQEALNAFGYIKLGIGLPPKHYYLKDKTLAYFENVFKNGISFEHNGLCYNLTLKTVQLFPQGVSAILVKDRLKLDITIPNEFSDFAVVDIGSFTVITVPFEAGNPNPAKNEVYEIGIFCMCDFILSHVKERFGITLTRMKVISVLRNEKTILEKNVIDYIKELTSDWTNKIVNELRQHGLEFKSTPVVFMGGGSQLLKPYINQHSLIGYHEFITDTNMNAKAYSLLLRIYDKE